MTTNRITNFYKLANRVWENKSHGEYTHGPFFVRFSTFSYVFSSRGKSTVRSFPIAVLCIYFLANWIVIITRNGSFSQKNLCKRVCSHIWKYGSHHLSTNISSNFFQSLTVYSERKFNSKNANKKAPKRFHKETKT